MSFSSNLVEYIIFIVIWKRNSLSYGRTKEDKINRARHANLGQGHETLGLSSLDIWSEPVRFNNTLDVSRALWREASRGRVFCAHLKVNTQGYPWNKAKSFKVFDIILRAIFCVSILQEFGLFVRHWAESRGCWYWVIYYRCVVFQAYRGGTL